MSQELKALGILKELEIDISKFLNSFDKEYKKDDDYIGAKTTLLKIKEAIKELEKYEQNFKQKEFDYRTQCQSVLSTGRVEADNMLDRLAELEKVIMDYYLDKGYVFGVGGWVFKVNISTFYKLKDIQIMFRQDICSNWETIFRIDGKTTKEMWDKAIAHFTTRQNEVTNEQ